MDHFSSTNPKRPLLAAAVLLSLAAGASNALAAKTAGIQAITTWGDCGTAADARPDWDNMCIAWWAQMGKNGWGLGPISTEGNVIVDRFDGVQSWSADNTGPLGVDAFNASMVCTHGNRDANGWWGVMHHKVHGECGANANQLRLGPSSGGKLRFLHLSSCNSAHHGDWGDWLAAADGGVHLITGFHGYMYIGPNFVDDYAAMAQAGNQVSVGMSWQSYMKATAFWPWEVTTCPVTLGFGHDQTTAINRVMAERYNAFYANSSSGTNDQSLYAMYPGGCMANGADAPLP
jgi:hypothetical protein